MTELRHSPLCCCLKMKPLNEKQRDSLLGKILKISGSKDRGGKAIQVAEEMGKLKKSGYDIDSYLQVFWTFMRRYSIKA
jgi:hypothetical protein